MSQYEGWGGGRGMVIKYLYQSANFIRTQTCCKFNFAIWWIHVYLQNSGIVWGCSVGWGSNWWMDRDTWNSFQNKIWLWPQRTGLPFQIEVGGGDILPPLNVYPPPLSTLEKSLISDCFCSEVKLNVLRRKNWSIKWKYPR